MCIIRRNLFVGANKMVSVSELSIGGVVDGPSVRRLKDAQRLGLYQPDAEAERELATGIPVYLSGAKWQLLLLDSNQGPIG